MEPEINGPALPGDLDGQVMSQYVRLLMRNAPGFRSRHVRAVADGINVIPFGLQRIVVDTDTSCSVSARPLSRSTCAGRCGGTITNKS